VTPGARALRIGIPVLFLAAFVLHLREAGGIVRAQRLLQAVESRTLAMIRSGNLQRPLLLSHVKALEDAKRLDPGEVAIRVAEGSEYFLLGDLTRARVAYEAALALEPRPEIYLNLGKVYLAAGELGRAQEQFARALKGDPHLKREVPASARSEASESPGGQDDPHGAQKDGQIQPQ
jgi:Tfp pilus assembly protein PilF